MTKTNTAANTNPATVNFRAPIKAHMPINVNFRAPITVNLTYNSGASEEPLEKVSASDLQKYIAERLQGQCETVNPRVPTSNIPKAAPKSCNIPSSEPAPKNSDCTSISTPIRDRKESNNVPTDKPADAKKKTGVAEATIENRIMDEIVGKFGVPRNWLVSITPFKSAYEHYAVGTTGDLTYVAWVHSDGRITVKQQAW